MFPYTATNDTITIFIDGTPHVVTKGKPQFTALFDAIVKDDVEAARRALTLSGALANYLAGLTDFAFDGETITHQGKAIDNGMQERVKRMAVNGESPLPLLRFYARLQHNPSYRSVEQLWPFLQHQGIPIEEDGTFLAYKGVRDDLKDVHSGTIDNSPGRVIQMERNKISDDPRTPCHEGLHVGALAYASSFGPQTIVVRVDPANVVCIPYDHSAQKMRVCEYEVVGFHTVPLPDTTVKPEDVSTEPEGEEWEDEDLDNETDEEIVRRTVITDEVEPKTFFLNEQHEISDDEEGVTAGRGKRPVDHEALKKAQENKLRRFSKLSTVGLLEETLEDLRAYAGKLKIVGASKLPGGKTALVKKIVRVRARQK